MAPNSRDPYAPVEAPWRGRRLLAVGSALIVGLIVALVILAILAVVLRASQ